MLFTSLLWEHHPPLLDIRVSISFSAAVPVPKLTPFQRETTHLSSLIISQRPNLRNLRHLHSRLALPRAGNCDIPFRSSELNMDRPRAPHRRKNHLTSDLGFLPRGTMAGWILGASVYQKLPSQAQPRPPAAVILLTSSSPRSTSSSKSTTSLWLPRPQRGGQSKSSNSIWEPSESSAVSPSELSRVINE